MLQIANTPRPKKVFNQMKIGISCLLPIWFLIQATTVVQPQVEISLKNNSSLEQQSKQQLQRLLKTYDVSPWFFTKSVLIDEKSTPHSHPVLTLHTRHLRDDELLLSTFVHEQLHWYFVENSKQTDNAIKDLQTKFPNLPVGFPDGAKSEESGYLHLLVNYWEYRSIRNLLGELKARQVMEFWATDHYRMIYRTVLDRGREIGEISFKHKLVPVQVPR